MIIILFAYKLFRNNMIMLHYVVQSGQCVFWHLTVHVLWYFDNISFFNAIFKEFWVLHFWRSIPRSFHVLTNWCLGSLEENVVLGLSTWKLLYCLVLFLFSLNKLSRPFDKRLFLGRAWIVRYAYGKYYYHHDSTVKVEIFLENLILLFLCQNPH